MAADWLPTAITGIASLVGGAFGVKVLDSWLHGRAQRRAALGERETRLDRALASRLVWLNDSMRQRGIVYRRAPDEATDLPDDPWCLNNKKE